MFTDKISMKGCAYILSLSDKEIMDIFREDRGGEEPRADKIYTPEQYCAVVKRNCTAWMQQGRGKEFIEIQQSYHYSKGRSAGRIYVSGFGIASLQSSLRKMVSGDYYCDIDIKNAHPNLLFGMVRDYNHSYQDEDDPLPHKYLKDYCINRAQVLQKYGIKKMDVLVCLNSDVCKSKNAFLKRFHAEKTEMFETFLGNATYMERFKALNNNEDITTTNTDNPTSSKVNLMFCLQENKLIQQHMQPEHTNIVPMFDGFMFDKKHKKHYDKMLTHDKLIQWDYKSNVCERQEFIDFTLDDADQLLKRLEWLQKIADAVDDGLLVDGEVLSIVVEWLMSLCGDDIIYHDNTYYTYEAGIFKRGVGKDYELKRRLHKHIVPHIHAACKQRHGEFISACKALKQAQAAAKDQNTIDAKEAAKVKAKTAYEQWNMLHKNVASVKNVPYVVQGYVERSTFHKSDFYDKLDAKPNLIAFNNCVYDLYAGHFRPIEKSDYISITTGYNWEEPDDTLMREFESQFLHKVFVDEETRTHFLKTLCASLDGMKRRHKFNIWSNFGRNGKSITMNALSKMLGDYYGVLNSAALQCNKQEAGQAAPQFIVLKTCRVVSVNEPESSKKINSNLIKELSGGDPVVLRRLYSSQMETFQPKASLTMPCNDIPNMDKSDGNDAAMMRLDIIPFLSTFGVRPDKSVIEHDDAEKKEFVADHSIENKLEGWRCCFFKSIVKHFNDYSNNPNFVLRSAMAEEYQRKQDMIKEFMDEKMKRRDGYDDESIPEKTKVKDIVHHLNTYLKGRADVKHTSKSLAKYFRTNKYKVEKHGSDVYLFYYIFNWE